MDAILIRFFYYKIALPAASGFAWWTQTVSLFMDPILIRFFIFLLQDCFKWIFQILNDTIISMLGSLICEGVGPYAWAQVSYI